MSSAEPTDRTTSDEPAARNALFSALVGLTTLVVLLQGVWAGIFLEHDGERDAAETWINVHGIGAYVALALALAATVVAVLRLRARTDLVAGCSVLLVLLIAETGLGAAVGSGTDALTVIHIPLAMAIMGLAVWVSLRARSSR